MGMASAPSLNTYALNMKFLLIACVVTANTIEPMIDRSSPLFALYETIYSFHIPMFALAMGYFAKSFRLDRPGIDGLCTIAYQYVLFQTLYSLADIVFFQAKGVIHSFFMPYSLLWFLLSHFCWRLLLRAFVHMRHPLLVSLLLGVAVGYLPWSGAWLSVSRTLVYFPFFLAGYFLSQHWETMIKRLRMPAVLLGLAVLCFFWLGGRIDPRWLYGSFTYAEAGHPEWYAGIYRLGMYGVQAAASIAFLSLVPWAAGRITDWGKRTGYVFLLHAFILKSLLAAGVYVYLQTPWSQGLTIIAGFGIVWLLSQPWVETYAKPWFEPDITFVKRLVLKSHGTP